jgi:hypothetical protein
MMTNMLEYDRLAEQIRHNKATEKNSLLNTQANFATSLYNTETNAQVNLIGSSSRLLGTLAGKKTY